MRYISILFIIGANLLQINNVKSFVLVTANLADIKKLASKFVPPSAIEYVAGIVENIMKNVGEESSNITIQNTAKQLDPLDSISVENLKYQLDRKRASKESQNSEKIKPKESKAKVEPYHEEKRKMKKKRHRKQKKYDVKKRGSEDITVSKDLAHEVQNSFKEINTTDSSDDAVNAIPKYNQESSDLETKNFTSSSSKDESPFWKKQKTIYLEQDDFRRASMTTAREKNEFDQYFNYLPKYDSAIL